MRYHSFDRPSRKEDSNFRRGWQKVPFCLIVFAAVLNILTACNRGQDSPSLDEQTGSSGGAIRVLPTLYPTGTPFPTVIPTPMLPLSATSVPEEDPSFDQKAVEVRYRVEALQLDRLLIGNVAGTIELTDMTSGATSVRRDQPGIIIELQQALPRLELANQPAACEHCVWLGYDLPLTGDSDQGWLNDRQLLASVENYMAVTLGPHFPPGTVVGLRKSATPYYPAHTVAVTADSQLWGWSAADAEVAPAASITEAESAALNTRTTIDVEDVLVSYAASCPDGSGIDTLFISTGGGDRKVNLVCPALSLPAMLLPIYETMDSLADRVVADESLQEPEPVIPLNSAFIYMQADGDELIAYNDATAVVKTSAGQSYTGTISSTLFISLTQDIIAEDLLVPGSASFIAEKTANRLLVRGYEGVYEYVWTESDELSARFAAYLDRLERLERTIIESTIPPPE